MIRSWLRGGNSDLKVLLPWDNRLMIFLNPSSLSLSLFLQPEELTDVLEISNIVFTSMFVLEMGFMLLAFGLFGYIRNPYNIFDSIIVIIRYQSYNNTVLM